jgi:hypothetical protein
VKYTLGSAYRVPGDTLEDDLRVFVTHGMMLTGDMLRKCPQNNSEKRTSERIIIGCVIVKNQPLKKLSASRKKERHKILYNF